MENSCYTAESLHYLENLRTTHQAVYVSWQTAFEFFLFFLFLI